MAVLEEILNAMSPQQYALTVGKKSGDPLTGAFTKKRVVHPGVRGEVIAPPERMERWNQLLEAPADNTRPRAAYFHIPFCSRMCLYCGFFQNYTQEERETAYVDRLIHELSAVHGRPYFSGAPIQTVYIGGGTPSALSAANVKRLLKAIDLYVPLANDYELTLEARANDLTADKMEAWFAGGVNRVSVGVQSFDTGIRQMIGRIDDGKTVIERLRHLASYRQAAVVIDLIYGLPGQTTAKLLEDLAVVDTLPIDGMDLYQLNLFDTSPLKKAIDAGKLPPAAATSEQAAMYAAAETYLADRAYVKKSNCHWAKSSRERNLYNLLSKCGAELFPFGAGAGGNIGGYSFYLQRDLAKYLQSVDAGDKPMMVMMGQSPSQELHNDILMQLEQGYFDLDSLALKHGEVVSQLGGMLAIWEENGLLKRGAALSRLTLAGRFWQMNIAQSLLECAETLLEGNRQFIVERVAEQG